MCLGIVSLAVIPALYWQEPRIMLIPTYFVLSLLVVSVLNKNDIRIFVDLLTCVVLVVLCGAVIGTSYAYLGGGAILDFANPDGRLNQLYLTTLTNIQIENFIRPSGIFDEPGALSFVVCFLAALRHALRCNRKVTWVLLTFGFVTTSVAHLVYTLLHATEEVKDHKRVKGILITAVFLICSLMFVALFHSIQDIFSTFILRRFPYDLANLGQDRVTTFLNAVSYTNLSTFLFGLNSDCAVGLANCVDLGFDNYGDNPLTLLVHWGGLLAFPYYCILIYLAVTSIRHRSFVMLGLFLLLLQRPYTMSYGYSMLIVLTIFVFLNGHVSNGFGKFKIIPRTSVVEPST